MRSLFILLARSALLGILLTQIALSFFAIGLTIPSPFACDPNAHGLTFCHNDWQMVDVAIIVFCVAGIATTIASWRYGERWLKEHPAAFTHGEGVTGTAEPLPRWSIIALRSALTILIGVFSVQPIILNIIGAFVSPACPSPYQTEYVLAEPCNASAWNSQILGVMGRQTFALFIALGLWYIAEQELKRRGLIKPRRDLPSQNQN